jgi:Flp pilus assembly pilin Flp
MYKKLISLLKEEKGYNTVEALLWIAAVAVLSVAVTTALKEKLTVDGEGSTSAVNTINETINRLLEDVGAAGAGDVGAGTGNK